MSAEQAEVLRLLQQYVKATFDNQHPGALHWFLTGGAGVGKSYVVHLVREFLIRAHVNVVDKPVMLAAQTGKSIDDGVDRLSC